MPASIGSSSPTRSSASPIAQRQSRSCARHCAREFHRSALLHHDYLLATISRDMSQIPTSNEPSSSSSSSPLKRDGIPEGLWLRCPECGDMLFRKVVEEALHVCPQCQYHFRLSARKRVDQIVDPGSFEE